MSEEKPNTLTIATAWLLSALPLGLFIVLARNAEAIVSGVVYRLSVRWVPQLELSFSFRLDGLGLLFALLITGIGFLIVGYAGAYLRRPDDAPRFQLLLFSFMVAMLGVVTADNILTFYVAWELTTVASFLLIGFDDEKEQARSAAHRSLVVTALGGLALLAGLILLGFAAGSFDFSVIAGRREAIVSDPRYVPAFLLILAGVCAKSAQFPFHFWLPDAMAAPTPVSAYLHSAAMVKAGIYLLFRLSPALGGTAVWYGGLTAIGLLTMLTGAVLAFWSTDLKRILAYSTISALGMIVLFVGSGSARAVGGALVFTIAHAIYKSALFLVVGAVDHQAGGRDVEKLRGLAPAMPATAAAAALSALALAGFGPVLSFVGKERLMEAATRLPGIDAVVTFSLFLTAAFFTGVALLVAHRPFLTRGQRPKDVQEASPGLWIPPLLLAIAGIILGVFAQPIEPLVVGALGSIRAQHPVDLELWRGFTPRFLLSATAFVLGIALYASWERARHLARALDPLPKYGPLRWYERAMSLLAAAAERAGALFDRASLGTSLGIGLVVIAAALASRVRVDSAAAAGGAESHLIEPVIALLIVAAAVTAAVAGSRALAILAVGTVGYGVALIFVAYSAPDLAMTQLLVETLMVIFLVLVIRSLPPLAPEGAMRQGARLLIALASGTVVTLAVAGAGSAKASGFIGQFYARHTEALTHSRNAVGAIIVDFRSLDTVGEAVVFAAAAIGLWAVVRSRRERRGEWTR